MIPNMRTIWFLYKNVDRLHPVMEITAQIADFDNQQKHAIFPPKELHLPLRELGIRILKNLIIHPYSSDFCVSYHELL